MAADVTRVEIGFDGGLIVITKIAAKEWDERSRSTLKAGQGRGPVQRRRRLHVPVDVSKVSYVKHETPRRPGGLLTGRARGGRIPGSTGSSGRTPGPATTVCCGSRSASASGRPVRVAATVWGTLAVNYAVKSAVRRERPLDPGRATARPRPVVVVVPVQPRRDVDGRGDRARAGPAAAGAAVGGDGRGDGVEPGRTRACTTPSDVVAGVALGAVTGTVATAI